MWGPCSPILERLAVLYDDLVAGGDAVKISGEMRAIEDRFGMTPRSMLTLRWRYADPVERSAEPADAAGILDRRERMRVV
jgi:hypothetical protein